MATNGQKFKKYDNTIKITAINRIIMNKENYREVASDMQIPSGTLATWISNYRASNGVEIKKMKINKKNEKISVEMKYTKIIKELKEENDLLKKVIQAIEINTNQKSEAIDTIALKND